MAKTPSSPIDADGARLGRRLAAVRTSLESIADENHRVRDVVNDACTLLAQLAERREALRSINDRLAQSTASSVELLADLEAKNDALDRANRELARANARSAELVTEVEIKSEALDQANKQLARANAHAAELMGEVELKNEQIYRLNSALAQANAEAAEALAELEAGREKLERLNGALRSTEEDKRRLVGVVAHDLRGGLGGIASLAQLLHERGFADEMAAHERSELIAMEATRLRDLLSRLIDVPAIEQGSVELATEVCDVSSIVTDAVRLHRGFADLKRQTVEVEIDEEPIRAAVDPRRLRQVVDNLLSNAVKFAPFDSTVSVECRACGGEVIVCVEDEGPGLSDSELACVFGELEEASPGHAPTEPAGGKVVHGLGLAIARKIIEVHGGSIVADNREDRSGAHFAFTIPREVEELEESDSAESAGLSVLVVTDDAALGERSRELLGAAGCRVNVTGDGCEAGDRVVEIGPDLVLLDAEMSTPGGIETIELMRRLPDARGRVPIVVVSHDDDDRHQTRLREAGANSWLVKPLAQRDVASLLARWGASGREAPRPVRKER